MSPPSTVTHCPWRVVKFYRFSWQIKSVAHMVPMMTLWSPWLSSLPPSSSVPPTVMERQSIMAGIEVQTFPSTGSCSRSISVVVVCWHWLPEIVAENQDILLVRVSPDQLLCVNPRPCLSRKEIFVHISRPHVFFSSLFFATLPMPQSLRFDVGVILFLSILFFFFYASILTPRRVKWNKVQVKSKCHAMVS